jgi:hypothetical protein
MTIGSTQHTERLPQNNAVLLAADHSRWAVMSEVATTRVVSEEMVLTILTHLSRGKIDDANGMFCRRVHIQRPLGPEFQDKGCLARFFQMTRELFAESCVQLDSILMSVDHMVGEWKPHITVREPSHTGLARKVQILLPKVFEQH